MLRRCASFIEKKLRLHLRDLNTFTITARLLKKMLSVLLKVFEGIVVHYDTERMRQKLFTLASGELVITSMPPLPAALVICGDQFGFMRLLARSRA